MAILDLTGSVFEQFSDLGRTVLHQHISEFSAQSRKA